MIVKSIRRGSAYCLSYAIYAQFKCMLGFSAYAHCDRRRRFFSAEAWREADGLNKLLSASTLVYGTLGSASRSGRYDAAEAERNYWNLNL